MSLPPPDYAALHAALGRQCAARNLQATEYFILKAGRRPFCCVSGASVCHKMCVLCKSFQRGDHQRFGRGCLDSESDCPHHLNDHTASPGMPHPRGQSAPQATQLYEMVVVRHGLMLVGDAMR